ncbi:MAG TPA: hypothetical protein VIS48_12895 [Candidatus Kryptonia bacterium]
MHSYHVLPLRFALFTAIVLAFSSQVLFAQENVPEKRVQPKQTKTVQLKPQPAKTKQLKPKQTKNVPPKSQPGKITKLKIGVKPSLFNGHCPKTFDFHCTITVNHTPVTVEYEWLRSDGASGGKQRVEMRHTSVTVSDTWQLGEAKQHLREWEKVHIISPKDMNSPPAIIIVNCK